MLALVSLAQLDFNTLDETRVQNAHLRLYKAHQIDPTHPALTETLAHVLFTRKDYTKAEQVARYAISQGSQMAWYVLNK